MIGLKVGLNWNVRLGIPDCTYLPHRSTCDQCRYFPSCTRDPPWISLFVVEMCTFFVRSRKLKWKSNFTVFYNNRMNLLRIIYFKRSSSCFLFLLPRFREIVHLKIFKFSSMKYRKSFWWNVSSISQKRVEFLKFVRRPFLLGILWTKNKVYW